jgi:hypothetical protein
MVANVLVVVDNVLVVPDAIAFVSEVVEITPFTFDTMFEPLVVNVLPVTIVVVADTPLTVLVNTLPEAD